MASMTDDAGAAYEMAVRAAEALKQTHPKHELLRMVYGNDRHDEERWERFWVVEEHGEFDTAPQAKIDAITYSLLANAMDRVLKGPSLPSIMIERVSVVLDPGIDVFKATLKTEKPAGAWHHTASDQAQLTSFLEGAKAMARMLGGHMTMPYIPQHATSSIGGSPDIEDDIPF